MSLNLVFFEQKFYNFVLFQENNNFLGVYKGDGSKQKFNFCL